MVVGLTNTARLTLALAALLAAAGNALSSTPDLAHLSLKDALQVAQSGNLDVKLAAASERNALAARVTAGEAPNPTLTVQSFNINPHAGIGAGTLRQKTVDSAVRVDQLIERGNKRGLRVEGADSLAQAAHADLAEARRQLRIAVANAYYDLMSAQQKAAITGEIAGLYMRGAEVARLRQKAGDLSAADLVRVEVDSLRAQNDASQADQDLARARLALAAVLGTEAAPDAIAAVDQWPTTVPENAPDADSAIERRADVAAARLRVSAAQAAVRLAVASRTRDVTVGVQFEHFPASAANPQGSGNSVGVAVQVPLMLRNRFEGEIAQAHAALDAAEVSLQRVRQQARAELIASRAAGRSAAERLRRSERELLPGAKKAADAAEFAFSHGALSVSDMLEIRRSYRSALLDAIAARLDVAKASVAVQASIPEGESP